MKNSTVQNSPGVITMTKNAASVIYILLILVAGEEALKTLRKCCPKGQQIDQDMRTCIQYPGRLLSSEKSEILYPPNDLKVHYWLHPALQFVNLEVTYIQSFKDFELDAVGRNVYPQSGFSFRDLKGEVPPSMIEKERYCYDITPHPNSTHVLIWTMKLRSIHKCCGKSERLNARADACEILPEGHQTNVSEEIIGLPRSQEYLRWLPANLSQNILKINYNVLKSGTLFNNIVAQDRHFSWDMVSVENDPQTIIKFRGRNKAGYVDEVTHIFCFDELADEPQNHPVLLTTHYNINKCCNKNQEIKDISGICVARSGKSKENIKNKILNVTNDNNLFWLPKSVNYKPLAVEYGTIFKLILNPTPKIFLYNESMWKLKYSSQTILPVMELNYTELSGKDVVINTTSFCFDNLKGVSKIVVASIITEQNFIRKCCYAGEILSSQGICEKHEGMDWSPGLSASKTTYNQTLPEENLAIPLKYFCHSPFHIHSLNGNSLIEHAETQNMGFGQQGEDLYCKDWQQSQYGVQEVVASCMFPWNVKKNQIVLPLEAISLVMLVLAVAAMVSNGVMRSFGLGWGLIFHGLFLLLSSALQTASFHTWSLSNAECIPYMYGTYFCMVAAHWMLTVTAFSIFYHFKQPSKTEASLTRGCLGSWQQIAMLCLVAWGGASVLTILAVLMHTHRVLLRKSGFRIPSFLETRTCVFDIEFYIDSQRSPWIIPVTDPVGSLLYYFLPMWILAGFNVAFVVLTAMRIRDLRTATSSSQLSDSSQTSEYVPPQHVHNALLYVKLLLTTAVAELALGPLAWLSERPTIYTTPLYKTPISTVQNEYLFAIVMTLVSFIRAALVLWLSIRSLLKVEGVQDRIWWGWNVVRGLVQETWVSREREREGGDWARSPEAVDTSDVTGWNAAWKRVQQRCDGFRRRWSWLPRGRPVHAQNVPETDQRVELAERSSKLEEKEERDTSSTK